MVNEHGVWTKSMVAGLTLCLCMLASPLLATNYYVKTDGSDSADGLSWATAFATIGKAITVSANSDVVDVRPYDETRLVDLQRISDEQRKAFEKAEAEFQKHQEIPGIDPEPTQPEKVLGDL
jgi:hypothetical protein